MDELDLSRLNVLIVDDEHFMCELIKQLLHRLGIHNVTWVIDVPAALEEIHNAPIDLVIVDNFMQPMTGVELVSLVRNAHDVPDKDVPMIMVTGHTELRYIKQAKEAGVTSLLKKPIRTIDLKRHIEAAVRNRTEDLLFG